MYEPNPERPTRAREREQSRRPQSAIHCRPSLTDLRRWRLGLRAARVTSTLAQWLPEVRGSTPPDAKREFQDRPARGTDTLSAGPFDARSALLSVALASGVHQSHGRSRASCAFGERDRQGPSPLPAALAKNHQKALVRLSDRTWSRVTMHLGAVPAAARRCLLPGQRARIHVDLRVQNPFREEIQTPGERSGR